MAYKILRIKGKADFDVIPAAVLKCFPLEKRDYKPYTQAKAVISEEGITVRLMAFEALPEEKSSVKIIFKFSDSIFSAEVFADKNFVYKINNENKSDEIISPHFFTGEDLQGKYWAADFLIPMELIKNYDSKFSAEVNEIEGNIYKLCDGKRCHRGSYFPVDFVSEDAFKNFGIFKTEKY